MKHLLKLLWKNRSRNSLILVEMAISFLVLFFLFTSVYRNLNTYLKPLGFDYKNIWHLDVEFTYRKEASKSNLEIMAEIKNLLDAYHQIENYTMTASNVPYTRGTYMSSLHYENNASSNSFLYYVDDEFINVMNLNVIDGRWFNKTDDASSITPIVINKKMLHELFDNQSPVGKIVHSGDYKVVGIVDDYRHRGEFSNAMPGYFVRLEPDDVRDELLVKVNTNADAAFEAEITKAISSLAPNWTINVFKLEDARRNAHNKVLIPIIIFGLIAGFLIINVVFGMFGVLWHNISLRKEEIGIRRAVGSTGKGIYLQFIAEMFILATLGMIPAIIIAAQFPLLNVFNIDAYIYIEAIATSAFVIYLLVIMSALLPGRQAARIQPAMALHEN